MDDLREVIAGISAKMAEVGPEPFLASHSLLPTDQGVQFEKDGRKYFAAHPMMLERLPKADPVLNDPKALTISRPLFGITIRDLDRDSEARQEFYEAMSTAMFEASNAPT
jgi:hypothetical protein|tara:strand:+ start:659 stop:988 length:330 start_codon:yes stop_codon:yes gene_type:complete